MKGLQLKVLSIKDPSKREVINTKLNDLQSFVSKINEAAKQKHAVINQKFDEMQMMLDEEVKKQKLRIIERRCSVSSVSRTFQFGPSNLRITVSKPGYNGNNGGLNESEIEELTKSMEHTISQIQQNYINQNNVDNDVENVDNNSDDDDEYEYDLNKIFSQIEEDGKIEPEPEYGYDHCDNWMCYQCQHINPVTFETLTDSNKKCANCGSNGWPTKQEMDEMFKDSNIRYGEYFKKIMQ